MMVLEAWEFDKNRSRVNITQPGETWVNSDTFGMVKRRDGRHNLHATAEHMMSHHNEEVSITPSTTACRIYGWSLQDQQKRHEKLVLRVSEKIKKRDAQGLFSFMADPLEMR